jgi:dihydropyrimidine dehydrogenase (NAD+) subunit PreA
MKKLEVKYKNITFENPFILASAPPTRNAEMIARAFEAGWAGAVTKTICLNHKDMVDASPRYYGFKELSGFQNIELISNRSPQDWVNDIKFLKEYYPTKVLIASISAEADNFLAWKKLAEMMEKAGADILELNLSCPHGLPEKNMGRACCDFPELSARIVSEVRSASSIPVWVKLSAISANISYLSQLCLEAGADGITAINTVRGFAGIDIETGLPKLNIGSKSTYGGMSGSLIKPLAMQCVAEIATENNCFISATGGVTCWQDAVEFMMLGASTIQVCTKVMFDGYDVVKPMLKGLTSYLEKNNCDSASLLTGKALSKIASFSEINKDIMSCPEICKESCTKCGKCYTSCNDAGYQAISFVRGSFPEINIKKCVGCGLCNIICPVNSINMKENILSNT